MPESVVNVVVVIADLVEFVVIVGVVIVVVVNNCSDPFKEATATNKLHYFAFKDYMLVIVATAINSIDSTN
jgi:hypothetical protein